MSRFLALAFLLVSSTFASAQQAILTGTVTDDAKQPVPGIVVHVMPGDGQAVTAIDGKYTVTTTGGEKTVEFMGMGFTTRKETITLKSDQPNRLDITLASSLKELGPLVITAGKFEQKLDDVVVSMEVLKPSSIENSNQTTMETAVEKVPGLTVIDGQANIRGGSGFSYGAGSRVLVLVDDLPMLAGDAGDVKWSFLPVENIAQVEVVKGASSALFGSSALNGVINIRTKYPTDKPETHLTMFAGLYDKPADKSMDWSNGTALMTGGVQFSHLQKIGETDVTIGGQAFNDDGYREGEKEARYRMHASLQQHFKKITGLTAGISVIGQQSKGGNFLLWANDSTGALQPLGGVGGNSSTLSLYKTTRFALDPSLTYTGKKFSHRIRTRYFFTNNENNTNQEAKSKFYYGEYLLQWHVREGITWSAGLNATSTEVSGDLYGKRKASSLAAYTQADATFGRLNLSAGARTESATQVGKKLKAKQLLRTGASYRLFEATHLRASWGQGFRFPSLAEKYVKTQVGNIVIYPNDSLQTETGWSAEVGIRQGVKVGKWQGLIDLAYFRTEYTDMMEFSFGQWGDQAVDPLFGLGFKSVNVGNTRITGFEASISGEGKIGKVDQSLMTGITLIDPRQTDFNPAIDTILNTSTENILKYRYKTLFKFDGETGYKKFSFGYSARYYSFMENIDRVFLDLIPGVKDYRSKHTSGDWVFDALLSWSPAPTTRVSFIVKNVLNHAYEGRPADLQPQRSFVLQLTLNSF